MTDLILRYGGDILWAISLGVMANLSRTALRMIPKGEPTPAPWNFSGASGPRAPRVLALVFTPTIAFLVGCGLVVVAGLHQTMDLDAMMIFGARALLAALFALAHVTHVRGALALLRAEGKLKP